MKQIKLSFACPSCKQENILICYEEVLKVAFAILECPKCHKKFKCEFSEQAKNGKEMNCFYFGCLHQIKGDCPILNGGKK